MKRSIAVGDIAFWNELMFLKLVTKWQEIQKSKNLVVVRFFLKKNFYIISWNCKFAVNYVKPLSHQNPLKKKK